MAEIDFNLSQIDRLKITIISGLDRIFQRGVTHCQSEGTYQIVMSFLPPVVGCLLKRAHKNGVTCTPGPNPPPSYALIRLSYA